MSDMTEPPRAGDTPRILIIQARFYDDISDMLLDGARTFIEGKNLPFDVVTVPGCLEIPAALRYAVRSREFSNLHPRYDGYVILGCVIRGETTHYDLVCRECSQGVMTMASDYCLALGFGVLTVESKDQALARADTSRGDQGGKAARACLHMIDIKRHFHMYPR